ncbi:hypothetical protein DFH08DRAFT_977723 [Mycena albidolilacea]|uniref:Uncharacterized protein n=1 Tax=Mycena albidolilacea TaxID=1033008 RepID=A0AAD6Z131_9AGAR|nr:hypothetical protein DFH08DRAFT_977723 [Mycena albidolilacea]
MPRRLLCRAPRWRPRHCCALLPCAAARIPFRPCPCPPPRACLRVGTPVPPPSTPRPRPSPAPVLVSIGVGRLFSDFGLGRDDVGDSFMSNSVKWASFSTEGRLRAGLPAPALCVAALQSVTRGALGNLAPSMETMHPNPRLHTI